MKTEARSQKSEGGERPPVGGSLPSEFCIREAKYRVDQFGVIHQQPPYTMPQYDVGYISERYDTIPESVLNLSYLRAGFILAACGPVESVLDIGYGSGGFLRAMSQTGAVCAGSDISGYPVPAGCRFIAPADVANNRWDVVTFYDSLEHFPDLSLLGRLRADYVAITVPCVCHHPTVDWLAGWKHLRPGEHLHHFTPAALHSFMNQAYGYQLTAQGWPEDLIRLPRPDEHNILTMVFER